MKPRIPERFHSQRLEYERIGPDHAAPLTALLRDPRVMRTLWPWSTVPGDDQIRSSLDGKIHHWERHGFGMWALFDRNREFVGRGGLQYTDVLGTRVIEVGWAIVPERWGQGLATELALTSVEIAFSRLDVREVIAFTLPDNVASRRVMEKAGFAYEREIVHAGLPHVVYRRRAPANAAPPNAGTANAAPANAAPTATLTHTSRPPL
ncbi:MAG TPA: GNAT family N-acetyltransferase [Solirubrobacteraceae bacterium]